jgi:hypothetical protein
VFSEEGAGIRVVEPDQAELRQPGAGVRALAGTYGEYHHDALVGQSPSGERQRARRRLVEPLSVVEQHQQWRALREV